MWNVIKSLLAGAAVLFGLLCLYAGTVGAGVIIKCGGGPAAIPVLLISWLVGLLIMSVGYSALSDGGEEAPGGGPPQPPKESFDGFIRRTGASSPHVVYVAQYIRQAHAADKPGELARRVIANAGWSQEAVEEAERLYAGWEATRKGAPADNGS